ncbi:hypothetical protein TSAR_015212 [Trichomalopsis sarcophagae]|uniref:Uncharacterized protein n=1 Tax=Trichomalopsis sarcophagae TaxID=543379 RepID=A0A232FGE8_9HYME|nr:hypothetical protein TSAR_015212 [Trichomalopsis sarcophagae]
MWHASIEEAIITKNTCYFDNLIRSVGLSNLNYYIRDEEGFSLLHVAVKHNVDQMVNYFLDKGLGESAGTTNAGLTVLQLAVHFYKHSTFELLLNYGFDINDKGAFGCTPLFIATVKYSTLYRSDFPEPNVISQLIQYGADVNTATELGDTPLLCAIVHDAGPLVLIYIEYGADVGHCDVDGHNALHYAAKRGQWKTVEILLDAGADVDSLTDEGSTALHLAVGNYSNADTVELLMRRGANVNIKDYGGKTPIFMAIEAGIGDDEGEEDEEEEFPEHRIYNITRHLLDAGAEVNAISAAGEPVFHRVLVYGVDEIIELFLERGADIHSRNANGIAVIHVAVAHASERILKMLIDRGVTVDVKNSLGATPLHIAALFGKEEHAELLLARGANVNAIDKGGCTPLHFATQFSWWDEDKAMNGVHELLIHNGADPLIESNSGTSPLDEAFAISNAAMTRFLLRHLAYMEALGNSEASEVAMRGIDKEEQWLEIYKNCQLEFAQMKETKIFRNISYFDLIGRNLEKSVRDIRFVEAFVGNQTIRKFDFYKQICQKFVNALYRTITDALYKQNTDFFDAELRKSDELMDVTHGEEGYSLLHYAIRYCSERMVVYFLDRGFPVEKRTFYGQTALHMAVIYCKYSVVKLLIKRGSIINARDSMGRTALHYAMEADSIEHVTADGCNLPDELKDLVMYKDYAPRLKNKILLLYCTEKRSEEDFLSDNNRDIISYLLGCGADVNASTKEGDTPLFQAIARASPSWVQYFLERGANLKQCKQNYNALHYAAWMSDDKKLVELMLDAGIEVNSATKDMKHTALHLAASSAKNVEIVNLLIERGANIHAKDAKGDTPIFWAIGSAITYDYRNELDLIAIYPKEAGKFRGLLASIEKLTFSISESPPCDLYDEPQKVQRRHQIICSLLNAGVDVNDTNDNGVMAFHRALNTGLNSLIEPFLERDVNVHAKSPEGLPVLHAAVKFASETVLETLIDKGASMDDKIPQFGVSPLHLATQLCNEKHLMLLLAKGANVNITDSKGCTPLHYTTFAINEYSLEPYSLIDKLIGILLDNGADFFARSIDGKTTLEFAIRIYSEQAIESLLRHLAYLEAMDDPRAVELATRVIGKNDKLKPIYEKYELELVSMKEEKIYADVHYMDMITLDLKIWVRNNEFVEAFKNNQTIKKFYFYEKVSKKFDYALRARDASECIALLFSHIGLPIEVCEMIVEYFKLEDLLKMQVDQVLIG